MTEACAARRYTIARGRPADLSHIAGIERAAATLLAGHVPPAVLGQVTEAWRLEGAQRRGRLWVARADERPVGFALVELLEPDVAHLAEVGVHPDHGRQGLGGRMVRAVCAWARAGGYHEVTLTTFRDLPWNLPFYARLGFREIPAPERTPALTAALAHELQAGLDPSRRVAMRWRPASHVPPTP